LGAGLWGMSAKHAGANSRTTHALCLPSGTENLPHTPLFAEHLGSHRDERPRGMVRKARV
jgi:hypothetical protein